VKTGLGVYCYNNHSFYLEIQDRLTGELICTIAILNFTWLMSRTSPFLFLF